MSKNLDLKPLLDHILSFENYPDIFCALFAKSETIDEWLKLPFLRQKEDIDKIQKGPVHEAALIRITEERKKANRMTPARPSYERLARACFQKSSEPSL
jgi:hypothetical protein